jgi:acyl-CoA thioester hydrolase
MTEETPTAALAANEPGYVHEIRVRYGECDQQGVVFNANYLVYIDDAIDRWFHAAFDGNYLGEFDCMAKKIDLEWHAPAKSGDNLALAMRAVRWGNTSFDIRVDAFVGEQPIISATLVYVSVTPGTHTPCPVPGFIREALATPVRPDER